jgi:hypothetical protein
MTTVEREVNNTEYEINKIKEMTLLQKGALIDCLDVLKDWGLALIFLGITQLTITYSLYSLLTSKSQNKR